MSAKLIVEEGELKDVVLSFESGTEWIIGRDPDQADLTIEDPTVSRIHARCRLENSGIFIENLSETNPIEINGMVIEKPYLLQQGDLVTIGNQIFRFYAETTAYLFDEAKEVSSEEEKPQKEIEEKKTKETEKEEEKEKMMETKHESLFEEDEERGGSVLAEINFDLLDSGRFLLKVVGGPNNGAEFSMQSGREYVIGTDPNSCDIIFHDTSVSRQHAKITVTEDDNLQIEDLKSKNGTLIEGNKLEKKEELPTNAIISMGTTAFIVYDREGEMQTIISPLLPSIVKVLQTETTEKEKEEETSKQQVVSKPEKKEESHVRALFILFMIGALLIGGGIGIANLFRAAKPIEKESSGNAKEVLQQIFSRYPSIKHSYNTSTNTLLLIGHVSTSAQKQQLLYELQGLPFIETIDDSGLIIDEFVWREMNLILAKNPEWRTVSVSAPSPGEFVMSGYLKTRKAADDLLNYIAINFPYLDLLEKRIVIEEDIINGTRAFLRQQGLNEVTLQVNEGEVTFAGTIGSDKQQDFQEILQKIKTIPGVRDVRSFVTEVARKEGLIDISDEYEVTGSSSIGGRISVVVNGKIVSRGDTLDGRLIQEIRPNAIILRGSDKQQYVINY